MATVTSLLGVAWRSLLYRFGGVLLTIVSVAISVFVLLGVEHVGQEALQWLLPVRFPVWI